MTAARDTRAEEPSARELTLALGGRWSDSASTGNALCPAHVDREPSLDIAAKDGRTVFTCRAGCAQADVLAALRNAGRWPQKAPRKAPAKIVATYDYCDADGVMRFQVCRLDPKSFRQRQPNGKGGWFWSTKGAPRLIYRLPEVLAVIAAGKPVAVVEGEKDANALWALGIPATCNVAGAGKWRHEDSAQLAGADVVIIPDNDGAGRSHAELVVRALAGIAARVRVLELPDLPDKGDVSDWLAAGGTAERLSELARSAPDAQPSDDGQRMAAGVARLEALAEEQEREAGGPHAPFERQGPFVVVREWTTLAHRKRAPGVWWVETDNEGGERWNELCTRLEPLAATRGRDQLNWGRFLELYDLDGHRQVWPMPMSRLERDGAEFRAALADRGLNRTAGPKGAMQLERFLRSWRPSRRMRSVERVGWCGDTFVLPDRQYGGKEECTLQLEGTGPEFEVRGTLDGWRESVAALCVGNSRLMFSAAIAFAGPLIRLTGEESGGFHFWGASSTGKTTLAHVTRSVWGAALGSWRGTDNAAEATAVGANDTALVLDEIGQADGRVVAALSYMLGNGRGKSRMMANATLRRHHKWSVLFVSTGELPVAAKLLEDGQAVRAGQAVRVLEIKADAGAGMGVFESVPPSFSGPAALAEHIRDAADYERGANPQCGTAARSYLERLTEDVPRWTVEAIRLRDAFVARHCPDRADGQVRRACGRFGLVAAGGTLATRFGITGWADEDAGQAAAQLFREWIDQRGGKGSAEVTEALARVRLFLEQHGESRFTPAWDRTTTHVAADGDDVDKPKTDKSTVNRAGFRRYADGEGWTYYVLPEVWRREVCRGLDPAMAAKEMTARKWMLPGDGKHQAKRERVPGENPQQRYYVVLPSFFDAEP